MERIGTWNSDFAVWLVVLMLSPVFIVFLFQILSKALELFSTDASNQEATKEPGFEDVKRAALEKAAAGDRYARDWCTKNIFSVESEYFGPKQKKPELLTSQKVVDETIQALVAVGYKEKDAKVLACKYASKQEYKETGAMFLDIIQKKY
jgi:hypothetical protein